MERPHPERNHAPAPEVRPIGHSLQRLDEAGLTDNRARGTTERQLQALVADSPQVRQLRALQEAADRRPQAAVQSAHAAAQEGVGGVGAPLPHLAQIQRSFGHHDVSQVQAYTGGRAAAASRAIGAQAYATGDKVAFASANPGLHVAAHEAAHVVQQRAGVQLSGGMGAAGDTYEQHADEVAAQVVQGRSAQPQLDRFNGRAHRAGQSTQLHAPVQRLIGIEAELHVPVFTGGGANDDQIIRNFLGGGIIERQVLAGPAGGFKKVTDHDDIGARIDGARNTIDNMLKNAKQPGIAAPAHKVAIMEYVTDPGVLPPAYDESTGVGRAALRQSATNMDIDMTAVLNNAKAGTNALPGAFAANVEYGIPPMPVWDGFAVANGLSVPFINGYHQTLTQHIDDTLGVQASVGIRAKGLRKFLRKVGNDNTLTGDFKDNVAPGNDAAPWISLLTSEAAQVGGNIVEHISTGGLVHHWFRAPTPQMAAAAIRGNKPLKGFVSLIVAGIFGLFMTRRRLQGNMGAQAKNAVAFLPRTPLTNVLLELDASVRPDQWPAAQRNSLVTEITQRAIARLNAAPVNRIGGDDAGVNAMGIVPNWQNWVQSVVSNPAAGDAFYANIGATTQVDPHDHPDSSVINPVVGVGPGVDHPRAYKDAKGNDKAKSGAIVGELRFIEGVQPAGLLALVNNIITKVRESNN